MKRVMISFLVLAFASGLAFAQATQPAGKTHDVTGAVVKTDAAAKGWEEGVDDPVLGLELLVLDLCS